MPQADSPRAAFCAHAAALKAGEAKSKTAPTLLDITPGIANLCLGFLPVGPWGLGPEAENRLFPVSFVPGSRRSTAHERRGENEEAAN